MSMSFLVMSISFVSGSIQILTVCLPRKTEGPPEWSTLGSISQPDCHPAGCPGQRQYQDHLHQGGHAVA